MPLRKLFLVFLALLALAPAASAHGYWGRRWGFGFSYHRYRPYYGFAYRSWYPTYGYWGGFGYYRPWPRLYYRYYTPPVVVIEREVVRERDYDRQRYRDDDPPRRGRDAFGRRY
jgi:hypothetical protein